MDVYVFDPYDPLNKEIQPKENLKQFLLMLKSWLKLWTASLKKNQNTMMSVS